MTITAKQLNAALKKLELRFDKKFAHELWGQRKEFERYTGALGKHFSDQVKVVAEIASGIQAQLIAIRDMVARNTEDITSLQIELRAVRDMVAKNTEDIAGIQVQLTSTQTQLVAVRDIVTKNAEDITVIKTDTIRNQKYTPTENGCCRVCNARAKSGTA